MPIPIFLQPPNSFRTKEHLRDAALNLYRDGRAGGTLVQDFYEDNVALQCLMDAAGSILHYTDQIIAGQCLDHGAQIGQLANGNILLHATSTHHDAGNCSLVCEFVPANNTINVHAIGAHRDGLYRYDGVSDVLHPVLEKNRLNRNGWRYVDANRDAVRH